MTHLITATRDGHTSYYRRTLTHESEELMVTSQALATAISDPDEAKETMNRMRSLWQAYKGWSVVVDTEEML